MPINNRGLAGQPILPYIDFRVYAGVDAFVDMVLLDHTMTAAVPTSLTYQLDDLTNGIPMIPLTSVTPLPTSPAYTLQLPAASLQMTYPYLGSQLCQLIVRAVVTDSVTGQPANIAGVYILELCAVQTPGGA